RVSAHTIGNIDLAPILRLVDRKASVAESTNGDIADGDRPFSLMSRVLACGESRGLDALAVTSQVAVAFLIDVENIAIQYEPDAMLCLRAEYHQAVLRCIRLVGWFLGDTAVDLAQIGRARRKRPHSYKCHRLA